MKESRLLNVSVTLFIIYIIIVISTDLSFTGFWTDLIVTLIFTNIIFALILVKKARKPIREIPFLIIGISNLVLTVFLFVLFGFYLFTPLGWDIQKTRSFNFLKVENRLFNAYFKPVGSYSGGEGNFWITESPIFFPIIEKEVYQEHAIQWDFRDQEWEGEPIDQTSIVEHYILDEIIKKEK